MNYKNFLKLKSVGNELCMRTDFQFRIYRRKRYYAPGVTDMMIPKKSQKSKRYIRIYLSAIKNDKYPTDNTEFLAALICIFHEYKHLLQFYSFQKEVTDINQIASFLLSLYEDRRLYEENHEKLLFEIEAEQYGMMQAYSYMINHHFTPTETLKCISEYIVRKKTMVSLYKELDLPSRIQSIEDVSNSIEVYKENILLKSSLEISHFINDEYDLLQRLVNVEQQTKYVASCVLDEHPDYKSFFSSNITKIYKKEVYMKLIKEFPNNVEWTKWLETSLKLLELLSEH